MKRCRHPATSRAGGPDTYLTKTTRSSRIPPIIPVIDRFHVARTPNPTLGKEARRMLLAAATRYVTFFELTTYTSVLLNLLGVRQRLLIADVIAPLASDLIQRLPRL